MTEVTPNLPHFGSFCKYCFMGTLLLFAGQLCLLRFVQLSELPKGLPLAAGVLVLCMVLQCIRLAARSEYIAEG